LILGRNVIPDLSTAELMEMSYLATELFDRLFEYWLNATFAVIIASHFIGRQMTRYMFLLLVTIYGLFTLNILNRSINSGTRLVEIIFALNERGESPVPVFFASLITGLTFAAIFAIGTLGTMYFIRLNYKKYEEAQTQSTADT